MVEDACHSSWRYHAASSLHDQHAASTPRSLSVAAAAVVSSGRITVLATSARRKWPLFGPPDQRSTIHDQHALSGIGQGDLQAPIEGVAVLPVAFLLRPDDVHRTQIVWGSRVKVRSLYLTWFRSHG